MSPNHRAGHSGDSSGDTDINITPLPSIVTSKPWVQLVAGIICMAMVANLQYGWTIFISPLMPNTTGAKQQSRLLLHSLFSSKPGLFPLRRILPTVSARALS